MQNVSTPQAGIKNRLPDSSARFAGVCLVLAAAATIVMVLARAAGADHDALLEPLHAVNENRALYGISGAARLLSGLALFVAAWFLLLTWIIRERWATPLVPYLFALSGVCTAVSGACAVFITVYPPAEISSIVGSATREIGEPVEVVSKLGWIAGKIGFSAAGLAVIVAARYQWQVGGTLRWIAPDSLIIGAAMQVIWVDSATILHAVVGTTFFLWLLSVGAMLGTGSVEKHFVARYAPKISESNRS